MFYFIPLRTAEVSARRPWANYALMAVTVALTAFAWTGGDLDFARRVATYGLGGTSGLDLVSHNFLHANVWHLLANLVGLWVFGNAICARVGSAAYIPLYLALGAATGLVAKLFGTPLAIGASGTINALVGLAVVTSPRIRVTAVVGAFWHVRKVDLPSAWFVAVWVLIDVVGAFAFDDGVAYGAHLAGFAVGALTGVAAHRLRLWDEDAGELGLRARRRAAALAGPIPTAAAAPEPVAVAMGPATPRPRARPVVRTTPPRPVVLATTPDAGQAGLRADPLVKTLRCACGGEVAAMLAFGPATYRCPRCGEALAG